MRAAKELGVSDSSVRGHGMAGSYRAPVAVKYRVGLGKSSWWSSKTLGFRELTVSATTIEVWATVRGLGRMLGYEWSVVSSRTCCKASRVPRAWYHPRVWIVLGDEREMIAVTKRGALGEIWDALLESGVTPLSGPPS
jgi:hypothetical protein